MSASLAIYGLLPALISGYLFNRIFCYSKYPFLRSESQRLFIQSAGTGVVITVFVFVITNCFKIQILAFLQKHDLRPWIDAAHQSLPVEHASSLLLILVMGPVVAWLFNALISAARMFKASFIDHAEYMPMQGWMYWRAGTNAPTGYEILLHEAHREHKLVLLNLKSRKVYCGEIIHAPVPDRSGSVGFVKVLPKFSCHRDKDTMEISWNRVTVYPIYDIWVLRGFINSMQSIAAQAHKSSMYRPWLLKLMPKTAAKRILSKAKQAKLLISRVKHQMDNAEESVKRLVPTNGFSLDFKDWVKVISLDQIETASIYYDGIDSSWFAGKPEQGDETEKSQGSSLDDWLPI